MIVDQSRGEDIKLVSCRSVTQRGAAHGDRSYQAPVKAGNETLACAVAANSGTLRAHTARE